MFTGIVQGVRNVTEITDLKGGRRLRIQLNDLTKNLQHGSSISVNGVRLTVIKVEEGWAELTLFRNRLTVVILVLWKSVTALILSGLVILETKLEDIK